MSLLGVACSTLCGFATIGDFQRAHRHWVEQALHAGALAHEDRWSEAIAVGSQSFVEKMKGQLRLKERYHQIDEANGTYTLRESRGAHTANFDTKTAVLRSKNSLNLEQNFMFSNS